ncbi:MAG: VicK [Thermoleophilia bacterium]|nr:VicK [Thermoleophilia bacterium]
MGLTRAYVSMIALLAASCVTGAVAFVDLPAVGDLAMIAGFSLAFLLVQLLPVPFPRGSQVELVSVEEAVVIPLVLLADPAVGLIAVVVGVTLAHVAIRAEFLKSLFNVAQLVLSVAAAYAVTIAIAGASAPGFGARELFAAACGLAAMFVCNQLLVAGVIRLASGTPIRRVLREELTLKLGMWVANASIGMLVVLPAAEAPAVLLLGLVPLAMLHGAWRVHADRARDEQRLRDLGIAVGTLASEISIEQVARQVAEHARELMNAVGAEVSLVGHERRWRAERDDAGNVRSDTIEAGDREVDVSSRVSFSVSLAGNRGRLGTLSVWLPRDQHSGSRGFARRDRTLLEMLAHQASSALDNTLLASESARQQHTITQVFEHSSEGMFVLDRHGRVRGWNPAMQRMSGFELSTVDASPISLLSPQLAGIADNGGSGMLEAVLSTSEGERRHVRASYAPIAAPGSDAGDDDPRGESPAWVVVVRDVTSEQETERLKDDFVATVSHELRTPLTAIKGFLETMRRDDIELGEAQVRMFLQIMGEQADRLERMIGDLLDMSLIESGRPLVVETGPVDIDSSLRRALTVFEAARPQAEVEMTGADLGIVVSADSDRLTQVVTNLLDNAVKHGGVDTPVQLRVDYGDTVDKVVIEIEDRGPGIPASDQRHIFDRFYVTADSVTRTGGGAGLGLYICRRLMEAMHGSIDVSSEVGHGTIFRITIPAVAAIGQAPRRRRDDAPLDGPSALTSFDLGMGEA